MLAWESEYDSEPGSVFEDFEDESLLKAFEIFDSEYICKHFDPSVDAESRYYKRIGLIRRRVYDSNATMIKQPSDYADSDIKQPIVDSSCIGESPGKELDQCEFNGYLSADELCNPCEVKEFKEQCEYLCVRTGTPFGPYKIM